MGFRVAPGFIKREFVGNSKRWAPDRGCVTVVVHRKVVDNFLCRNVVSLTLTRHNEGMSNTLTYDTDHNPCVTYANNEWAWVRDEYISSSTRYSTAIEWWQYNVKTNKLVVQYKNSETFYNYYGVPFALVFALMTADSLGAFIAKEIKPHYSVVA